MLALVLHSFFIGIASNAGMSLLASPVRIMPAAIVIAALCAAPAAAQTPRPLRPGEVREGEAAARVDEYLSRLERFGFSGAVLIAAVPPGGTWAADGRVVLRRGYGLADRETGRPYTADMVSTIGSITKQFTGAAILKLEMMGRLQTSDPISKYLPGVPPDKQGITIHHLLTHTAGFPGDFGGTDNEPIERDALVARVLAAPLVRAPGERFEYSNEGYSLAGAIVERVSGKSYEAFLREELFLQADMTDTGYQAKAWPPERLPVGYFADGRPWGRVHKRGWLDDGPGWYLRANGGIHSTLDDMYRWHLALESTSVLSADARAKFQTGHVESPGGERYGYGWGVRKSRRGGAVITHNGGNQVFFADMWRYVDEGVVIIAMSNQPVVRATRLVPQEIDALYFNDRPVVMPPAGLDVPAAAREALAGVYSLDTGATIDVRATADGLEASSSDLQMFGALGSLAAPGGRAAALEARTMSLLEASAKGNHAPIYEAFVVEDGRTLAQVAEAQQARWDGWRARFGAFRRVELLGTGTGAQGDPAVTVRLVFERGGPTMQYVWGPRRLFAVREVTPAPIALVAETADSWVYYSYGQPNVVRLRFGAAGAIEIDGPAGRHLGKK